MIRADEAPTYLMELAASACYAALLQSLKETGHDYDPDWTWLTVAGGVTLSVAPAARLARARPGDWRCYERRVLAGFAVSGVVIVGWQLWQYAYRSGRLTGFDLARQIQEERDADDPPSLECSP